MILIYRNITIKNYTRIFFLFLPMIISITGLRPKSILHSIPFWFRAIPSFNQAKNAPGNQFCEVKRIQGIQHTLTAWDDMGNLHAIVG